MNSINQINLIVFFSLFTFQYNFPFISIPKSFPFPSFSLCSSSLLFLKLLNNKFRSVWSDFPDIDGDGAMMTHPAIVFFLFFLQNKTKNKNEKEKCKMFNCLFSDNVWKKTNDALTFSLQLTSGVFLFFKCYFQS